MVAMAVVVAPDRAMTAVTRMLTSVHAHFCVNALNVAPVHIFVNRYQFQHVAALQIEAGAGYSE